MEPLLNCNPEQNMERNPRSLIGHTVDEISTPALLADLDCRVLDVGGRHYLAKDATTTPSVIRAGYPRLDEFRAVRRRVDPTGMWASDQARRLELL